MADVIPQKYLDLFDKKAFGHLTTLMPDGSPQVTPVWIDYDGKHVRFNSARGRVKVRGRVVEITEIGADDPHQQALAEVRRQARLRGPQTG